ncbi:hypothetical protein ACIRVF_15515 [Kitasatospora sp. NPDC101157]|uniref:hypothetical protein n=1 Tax=Kitasatospora sp. NPDC101157 TaxID=3364098 RepID=UPI0038133FAA
MNENMHTVKCTGRKAFLGIIGFFCLLAAAVNTVAPAHVSAAPSVVTSADDLGWD